MRVFIILAISLLVACSSQPPQHSSYLLRSDKEVESRQLAFSSDIYLGTISLAGYIDQPGLTLANANGTVHQAKYHEWAEPLRDSLRQFFSTELSAQLAYEIPTRLQAGSTTRLDIHIDQLHGNSTGEAVLVARWTITGDKSISHQFSQSLPLQASGHDALVTTEQTLLEKLAKAIGDSISE
jgi:uncharacterized protein